MNTNPLIAQASSDRHQDAFVKHCSSCGSTVSTYNANPGLVVQRPEAKDWDWWAACDNVECAHAYGEGYFQSPVDWVEKK